MKKVLCAIAVSALVCAQACAMAPSNDTVSNVQQEISLCKKVAEQIVAQARQEVNGASTLADTIASCQKALVYMQLIVHTTMLSRVGMDSGRLTEQEAKTFADQKELFAYMIGWIESVMQAIKNSKSSRAATIPACVFMGTIIHPGCIVSNAVVESAEAAEQATLF